MTPRYTVNSEILVGFIFCKTFVKVNSSRNGEITLSFTDVGKSFPSCNFFYMSNVTFNTVWENKIIVKISEFTVFNQGS